jgi:hypothetical protein
VRTTRFLPLSRAKARAEASVLCMAVTVQPSEAGDLRSAVLARLAESGRDTGTLVLAIDGDIDASCLQTVCALHEGLRARGIQFRLVTGTQDLMTSASDATVSALEIHSSLRSAVLTACAALPGPGLMNAQVRAALSAPVEQLSLAPGEDEWEASSEVALGGPPEELNRRRSLAGPGRPVDHGRLRLVDRVPEHEGGNDLECALDDEPDPDQRRDDRDR